MPFKQLEIDATTISGHTSDYFASFEECVLSFLQA
jgi:hypothetical protein